MPQMKPINWMMIYFMMNLIMMFMNIKIFFNHKEKINFNNNNNFLSTKKINWKW